MLGGASYGFYSVIVYTGVHFCVPALLATSASHRVVASGCTDTHPYLWPLAHTNRVATLHLSGGGD